MLFAFSPEEYLPIVSLNDRKKIIEHFDIDCPIDFENDSSGKKIIESNNIILSGFKKQYNIDTKPYILSDFLYKKLRSEWKLVDESTSEVLEEDNGQEYLEPQSNFSMEKELENFIITNWDRTNLSKEYELIEEEGEMKSQQYHIDTGDFIDILVKNKKTGQYVVIELKKNKTSDKTIGQLARYMGWIEQHKSNGKPVKGIIIAPSYDEKLDYALRILKKANDIEVYIYEVDFKLKEFKRDLKENKKD